MPTIHDREGHLLYKGPRIGLADFPFAEGDEIDLEEDFECGPGEEDGPWAEGWEKRCGEGAENESITEDHL